MGAEQSSSDLSATSGSESVSNIHKAFRGGNHLDWSANDLEDVHSFELESEDGQRRLALLIESVPEDIRTSYPKLVEFICSASLRYAYGDVNKAGERVHNYLKWRVEYLGSLEPQTMSNCPEIQQGIRMNALSLVENIDGEGRAALIIRLRNTDPANFTALSVLKVWHYFVMTALQNPLTQAKGFYFIGDGMDAGFSNLDSRVPKSIMAAVSKNVPIRMYKVLMVRPMWILHLVLPILRLFLSQKLQERIIIVGNDPALLKDYGVNMALLPDNLSGTCESGLDAHVARWTKSDHSV
jgi:hypothetical protein